MALPPEYDLCVIGGGAAGLVCAAGAATLGAKVLLIEKHRLGGDCLYTGCVPSKALLHAAQQAQLQRMSSPYGIDSVAPKIDFTKVMAYVQSTIAAIEPNDSPERFESLGVELCFGQGAFVNPHTFQVHDRAITAKKFVLATGSRPSIPPIEGIKQTPYLTNEDVFTLQEPIDSLLVLGAGPIGLEMAQAFTRLGVTVTVVDLSSHILPREDADLSAVIHQRCIAEGTDFLLAHKPLQISGDQSQIKLLLSDPQGKQISLTAHKILVATGRAANTENLGLKQANVATNARGQLNLDRRLRTSNKNIYACGDVAGPYQFTHMAEHQAGVVLRNALFHLPTKTRDTNIPWCTFTDPELARVGLSESDASRQSAAYEVYKFRFEDIDRAQAEGDTDGFIKVITDKKDNILGAAVVGPHAGDIIHEYILAISQKMKLSALSALIHIYPTRAQINRRVADAVLKKRLTPKSKRWMQRLFRWRGPK